MSTTIYNCIQFAIKKCYYIDYILFCVCLKCIALFAQFLKLDVLIGTGYFRFGRVITGWNQLSGAFDSLCFSTQGYRTGYLYRERIDKKLEKSGRSTSEVMVPPTSSSYIYTFDDDSTRATCVYIVFI